MKRNKKPVLKKARKRPNRLFEGGKKPDFVVLLFVRHRIHLNYKNITRNFLPIWNRVLLGLVLEPFLLLIWLLMVC